MGKRHTAWRMTGDIKEISDSDITVYDSDTIARGCTAKPSTAVQRCHLWASVQRWPVAGRSAGEVTNNNCRRGFGGEVVISSTDRRRTLIVSRNGDERIATSEL